SQIFVSAPSAATTNIAFTLAVNAEDIYGNLVPSYAGTVKFTSSDAQAALPANSLITNGTVSFPVTLVTLGSQTVTATDTVMSSLKGTTGAITVVTNAATHIGVTGPDTSLARQTIQKTVTALDAANNTSTGYVGTVHFTSSDAQAKLPADSTLTAGTGDFFVSFLNAGEDTHHGDDHNKKFNTATRNGTVSVRT